MVSVRGFHSSVSWWILGRISCWRIFSRIQAGIREFHVSKKTIIGSNFLHCHALENPKYIIRSMNTEKVKENKSYGKNSNYIFKLGVQKPVLARSAVETCLLLHLTSNLTLLSKMWETLWRWLTSLFLLYRIEAIHWSIPDDPLSAIPSRKPQQMYIIPKPFTLCFVPGPSMSFIMPSLNRPNSLPAPVNVGVNTEVSSVKNRSGNVHIL